MMADTAAVYAAAYPIYRDLGWPVIKLAPATKYPPPTGFTGRNGQDPSGADMHAWAESDPGGNIAIRLPDGVIGIDCDNWDGKRGADTIAEAERRWGRLPYSPSSTSRDDGSRIRLYRIPAGIEFVEKLKFPQLGLGGVEIIQRHHRYVMCWPSIHDQTGETYRWLGIDGSPLAGPPALADIPDLPAAWLEGLRQTTETADPAPGGPYDVNHALTEGEASRRVSWRLGEAILSCEGGSRHDETRDHVLALLRYGKQGDSGVKPALVALQKVFVAAVGKDRTGGAAQAETEFRKFIKSKRTAELLAAPDYDDEAQDDGGGEADDEPTTWEPVDLGPWLAGERDSPTPTVGISRTDGQKVIYAGREHSVFGETESGKTWFALECAAVEIRLGHDVLYIHYEEGDPGSTIERLQLLSVTAEEIAKHLRFVAPARPARADWLTALLDPPPALVVHDGVNEAMSLQGDKTMETDGAASFRQRLIKPCLRVGAATLSCDHVTKNTDAPRGRYAIGAAHKVNAIDGAAFLVENIEPFGRGLRGASRVYVTKDRPGQLRAHGKPTGIPGKTFFGVLAVDATPGAGPDFLTFFAPRDDDPEQSAGGGEERLGEIICDLIAAMPGGEVGALRGLLAQLRNAGHQFRDSAVRDALDDLVAADKLVEFQGRRNALGYRLTTASRTSSETTASPTASASASPIGGEAGSSRTGSAAAAVGSSGKQSASKASKR